MKNAVKKLLGSLGFLVLLTKVKYLYTQLRMRKQNIAFQKTHPNFVMPPDYLMYEAYGLDYESYYNDGKATAKWLSEMVNPWISPNKVNSIFDWGCGPGRILRHLPEYFPNAKISGCDYNPSTVKWINVHFTAFDIKRNQINPPISLDGNTVDFAFGISIFTHLSEAGHTAWLAEIARILRPGGIFLFTTHGDVFQKRLTNYELKEYKNNKLTIRASGPEGHRVYGAFHPPRAIYELVSTQFSVLNHIIGTESINHINQDTWIIQKI